MILQFNNALTVPTETFQVSFTENEIKKLQTIKHMVEDIPLEDDTQITTVPLEILPNSIDLLKLILKVESYDKEKHNIIFTDYFNKKDDLMIKNTISSLLVFIDFMNIEDNLENIIYDISSYYLIDLSKKNQDSFQIKSNTKLNTIIL